MEIREFIKLITEKKQTILSVVIVFLSLSIVLTVIQPFKYATETRLMIVQNFVEGVDPYAMAKSNEYLGEILTRIIPSNSFYNEVMDSGYSINKNYFSGDIKKQMKKWDETVESKAINDTGIIEIAVYHKDKYQAEQIVQGINYTLKTKHGNYHSSNNRLDVKILDQPTTSDFPVKPNVILNLSLGAIFGLIIGLCYIYLYPEKKYDIKFLPNKKDRLAKINFDEDLSVAAPVFQAVNSQMQNDEYRDNGHDNEEQKEYSEKQEFSNISGNSEYQTVYQNILRNGDIKNVLR
ncbi:MAG: hypothetical protein ABH881_01335 [bacterium]